MRKHELDDTATAFGALLGLLLVAALQTWLVMLAVGALHSRAPQIPSLSFSACAWLVFVAYLLVFPATVNSRR